MDGVLTKYLKNGVAIKDRVTTKQLQNAQTIIHNQINIGDIEIHVKNRDINIDYNHIKMDKLLPLFNQLIKDVQGTSLESYLKEIKDKQEWPKLLDQLNEGLFTKQS